METGKSVTSSKPDDPRLEGEPGLGVSRGLPGAVGDGASVRDTWGVSGTKGRTHSRQRGQRGRGEASRVG